jgi:superfamily II DNA or RNA helicase
MITVKISGYIEISGLPAVHLDNIKKSLTLANPQYYKLLKMGVSVYALTKDFKYFWIPKGKLGVIIIPRGMMIRLEEYFSKTKLEAEYIYDTIQQQTKNPLTLQMSLRDYQPPLIEACLKYGECILKSGTGSGKSLMSFEVIRRRGLSATIIVPNTVLLHQFHDECVKFYGYKPGIIGDGKKEWEKDITIATVQSLTSDTDLLDKLSSKTSVLVVDECQGFVTPERRKVLMAFRPSAVLGLSATPFRSAADGQTDAVQFFFGKIAAEYEMPAMSPRVDFIKTGVDISVDNYPIMVDNMIGSDSRNRLICGLVLGEVMSGRKVLVLTKRIEHYKKMEEALGEREGFFYIDSEDTERNDKLAKMKTGELEFQAVFGTTSLMSVGTDLPSLDTLIIACDMKSDVLTIQSAGRIQRLFAGKQNPVIIDLFDDLNPIFANQFWTRRKIYKSKGWKCSF